MKRSYGEFLQDILDAIDEIEIFIDGISFETFRANREKILAVVKSLEIIGEAVKTIPRERRELYPLLPWKAIAGMKDILVHEYWQIDVAVVWATVLDSLSPLKEVIIQEIEKNRPTD